VTDPLFPEPGSTDIALSVRTHDRVGERRTDEAWLAEAWTAPTTRIVPLAGTRFPVDEAGEAVRWRSAADLPDAGMRIFLGSRDDVAHFALVVDEPSDEGRWTGFRGVVQTLPEPDAGFMVHAIALAEWHASHRFCPRDGSRLVASDAGHVLRCEAEAHQQSPRTDPAVTGAVAGRPVVAMVHLGRTGSMGAVVRTAGLADIFEQAGAEIVGVERVPDDASATRAALAHALESADVVVTSGGVSVGTRDHVKPALAALGVEQLFWRLAVQPGRPTWCGLRDGRVVVGLPGNPLSVMVGLELLLVPALRRLAGAADPGPSLFRLPLTSALRRDPQRLRVRPVRITTDGAEPLGADLSHQLGRAAVADALALVPVGEGELAAGAPVDLIGL